MGKAIICNLGKSRSFGRLSLKAKVLWPMLLVACDDQGRGDAAPDVVKWYICPNVNEISQDDIPKLFAEMEDQGMIHVYDDEDGEPVFQIVKWWEYQNPQWARRSKFDPPAGWIDRVRYNVRGGDYVEESWDCRGGFEALDEGDNPGGNPGGNPREPTRRREEEEKKQEERGNGRPPAIKVFRENAHRFPAKSWWDDVDERVGRDQPDLEFWGRVVKAYVGQGWNPTNVKNMLTFYEQRRVPGEDDGADASAYDGIDFGG